ncbi:hypothetical protein A3C09_00710 [Candidatus Uhrbacteria bacterium RIFCSPHIGHO2_02_FULL_47_44]|uniref:Pyruvate kinase n=1 Tax=Candidatus Uhrbacteria bacterium RIFCSPLOWO2_02_FULL_48_18 TaxID=1802408 RepID=A0A1F7VA83_9BACT|nr:MAG: hypothetical protein A2839_02535 [Candidatus Uhrbacteria bacterium RIFCSPHIGHO2_01_FULL_47_10]OGL69709.1 MAG: hypothetical protein A3C09_00710 [Candidatus Uhrbacteria bacterium RIFCSPHIGHO2_02_FULL_47_44]OGL77483.1 MAG: hypothetical protein A3E97_00705 [Candidatus Uhrbacteria bacterium RIFCSPHIGHO2_12_FULL_47_12]OGL81845.1 MAG: hypothetical protein A3B20_02010 [Candidatus Uhrbacteria bacterium RIFCSPLOWO2_01_FULL_47_17]OGL87008.1 MAG: hypothetical protein A3I41_03600 [Candidatus Uhrbact
MSDHSFELIATLWPGFAHFPEFAIDARLDGIRVNPATAPIEELEAAISNLQVRDAPVPLFYDVKGRQLRVEEAREHEGHLEVILNHPIRIDLRDPSARIVAFKAGADFATLDWIEDGGRRLIFKDGRTFGPKYKVNHGESLHIRHPSLEVLGNLFTDHELRKIEAAKRAGFTRFFLSYTESQSDVDQLRELVGQDAELWLKIENEKGLRFVENAFKKTDGVVLAAARGDLFIEVQRPHDILKAVKLIIKKDPEACVGSRILLSIATRAMPPPEKLRALQAIHAHAQDPNLLDLIVRIFHDPTPSCADFSELAWLAEIGYKRFLLCDELCLHKDLLNTAINAFRVFEEAYT